MTPEVWIGAGQFLIGAAIATWGVGELEEYDLTRRFGHAIASDHIRAWSITLAGFAIALLSPVTVLFVRF